MTTVHQHAGAETVGIRQRVDRHTHVPPEKQVLVPKFPDAIKIEITARCNYRCDYCATGRHFRKIGDMDPGFLRRILLQAGSKGVKEIGLFLLGEPFLVNELPEYIRFAKREAGIEYVFLTTNGYLCTPEKLTAVIDAGLDSLKFSINAGDRERYRTMHGVDGFETVLDNIRWLHGYKKSNDNIGLRTCVSSIFMPQFEDELERLRMTVADIVDEFYFLPPYNQAGHVDGSEYNKIAGNPGRWENMVPPVPCWALFNAAKITWDGWLSACCFDHDTNFHIADLNEVTLAEAWQHPKFVELRRKHLEKSELKKSPCAKCLAPLLKD